MQYRIYVVQVFSMYTVNTKEIQQCTKYTPKGSTVVMVPQGFPEDPMQLHVQGGAVIECNGPFSF